MSKHRRYNTSQKGRERYARYEASKKGVINRMRQDAKHKRALLTQLFDSQEDK